METEIYHNFISFWPKMIIIIIIIKILKNDDKSFMKTAWEISQEDLAKVLGRLWGPLAKNMFRPNWL